MKNLKAVLLTFFVCIFTVNVCRADGAVEGLADIVYTYLTIIFFMLNFIVYKFMKLSQKKDPKRSLKGTILFLITIIPSLIFNANIVIEAIASTHTSIPASLIKFTLIAFIIQLIIFLWKRNFFNYLWNHKLRKDLFNKFKEITKDFKFRT